MDSVLDKVQYLSEYKRKKYDLSTLSRIVQNKIKNLNIPTNYLEFNVDIITKWYLNF